MKRQFFIFLMLLIMAPVLVLAWLSYRMHQSEEIILQHQTQQLTDSRLREAEQLIQQFFSELESELLNTPNFYQRDDSNELIRQYVRQSSFIENIFVLNKEGVRLFPPVQALPGEKKFIAENATILSSLEAFRAPLSKPEGSQQLLEKLDDNKSIKREKRSSVDEKQRAEFTVSGSLGKLRQQQQIQKKQEEEKRKTFLGSKREYAESKTVSESNIAADSVESALMPQAQEQSLLEKSVPGAQEPSKSTRLEPAQDPMLASPLTQGLEDLWQDNGWTVWYAGKSNDVYFWFYDAEQRLIAMKLSPEYWLQQLIAQLPKTARRKSGDDSLLQLLNNQRQVVYQWGDYENIEQQQALGQRWLMHPLDGWQLRYFSELPRLNQFRTWLYGGLFVLLTISLALLGIWLFREYRRETLLAEQRVSFVNQVSHELKTPLTNICMYSDLIDAKVQEQEFNDSKVLTKYSQILTTESQRLGRLINNVLSFSRSQKEQQQVHLNPAIVDEIIQQTLHLFEPVFTSKGIAVSTDLQAKSKVGLDSELLEQVLNNLFGNVEKYASQGKKIFIRSQQNKGITTIWVADAGEGVSANLAKQIFQPFIRGSNQLTEGVSGTGIGLTIARDLCRLHGGDLQLDSVAEQFGLSQGACFRVELKTNELEQPK